MKKEKTETILLKYVTLSAIIKRKKPFLFNYSKLKNVYECVNT
jgi:hypothetical protein